ncbi:MAG: TetR/AcrR family transcriptional regulator [Burkholderiales bacterium]|nr:TetR/AcrR family transcriptional regulator [Burkholderiales bacterium]
MARPRSAGYDDHRERILSAAARLFATRGYAATTMNDVAAACGLSKATLYHYVRDKHDLLAQVSRAHVQRLEALVAEVLARGLAPKERLTALVECFMAAYAGAQHEHRVLTEDVKFLQPGPQAEVLDGQRRVVAAFAEAIAAARPELAAKPMAGALAMLLFGMMNWTFTWLRAAGPLSHEAVARMVSELFFGGLAAVRDPQGARPMPASPASPALSTIR